MDPPCVLYHGPRLLVALALISSTHSLPWLLDLHVSLFSVFDRPGCLYTFHVHIRLFPIRARFSVIVCCVSFLNFVVHVV